MKSARRSPPQRRDEFSPYAATDARAAEDNENLELLFLLSSFNLLSSIVVNPQSPASPKDLRNVESARRKK